MNYNSKFFETRYQAKKEGYQYITKVCGGFLAFETYEDLKIWKNQK